MALLLALACVVRSGPLLSLSTPPSPISCRWMRCLELESADAARHTGVLARMKTVTKVGCATQTC